MNTYVLYHANCADGFGAACAAHLRFNSKAQYLPVAYGKPLPEMVDGAEVYILDFSYPRHVLVELAQRVSKLVVLDHHETAREALEGLPGAFFDMSKSGARLAWEYFHHGTEAPELLRYVEDRDLWRWALPESRELSAALATYPQDFHVWLGWIYQADGLEVLKQEGRAILRAQRQLVERQCWNVRSGLFNQICQWVELFGGSNIISREEEREGVRHWWAPVVNATCHVSEVGEYLLGKFPDAPFVGVYLDKADGSRMWSLRSRKDFDCSVVAKAFGGGGHKQAAGFTEYPQVNVQHLEGGS